jgi:uncharacterized iron-regulated membrane protein
VSAEPAGNARPDGSLYRAVWRWHFYAGLIVLPFLLWLAITGGLYLYKPEVEALVYRDWSSVDATQPVMPLDPMIAAVERGAGGAVVQVMRPASPAASWRMTLRDPAGTRRLAFVDPHDGAVLGTTGDGGVMQTVRTLHSLAITGPVGNAVIEIVAGWAILLVLTGLYLWWPRRGSPVIGARGRPSGRTFWRDVHASVGLVGAAVILFLALTGMPWTGIAGKQLQSLVASSGLGRPKAPGPSPWATAKGHDHSAAKQSLPWSMQGMAHPMGHGSGDIGPGRAAAIAAGRGLVAPWTMTLPSAPAAPYLLSATIVRAQDARAIYIDAATGRVLQDARYAGFGAGARTIEWGIATHQGQQYGEPNRLVMLAGCIAIVLLALTAPLLWWKRRRNGRLEAPPRAIDRRKACGVAALMIVIGAAFPLTGASLVVALVLDMAVRRWRPAE